MLSGSQSGGEGGTDTVPCCCWASLTQRVSRHGWGECVQVMPVSPGGAWGRCWDQWWVAHPWARPASLWALGSSWRCGSRGPLGHVQTPPSLGQGTSRASGSLVSPPPAPDVPFSSGLVEALPPIKWTSWGLSSVSWVAQGLCSSSLGLSAKAALGHCSLGHGHQRPCVACVWLPRPRGVTAGGSLTAYGLSGSPAQQHLSLSPHLVPLPSPCCVSKTTCPLPLHCMGGIHGAPGHTHRCSSYWDVR